MLQIVPEDVREEVENQMNDEPAPQEVPMIYFCATMWHENKDEMTNLLKSIFR